MQNKNLRKALAVSMAIAMTGGLLAGCGNSSSGGSSNSGTTNSGSTSSASGELDTSEFVELSMYVISDRPSEQTVKRETELLLKDQLDRLGRVCKQISAAVLFRRRIRYGIQRNMAELCISGTERCIQEPG